MTTNMHTIDRSARALVGAALLLAWALGWISGTLALVLAALALVFLVTSAVGFCPLYRIVGFSTCAVAEKRGPRHSP
jgi:hypothetical protein